MGQNKNIKIFAINSKPSDNNIASFKEYKMRRQEWR